MIVYMLRRVGSGIVVFLTVTSACFFLYYLRGGENIARGLLPADSSEDQIQQRVVALGLDRPVLVQYADWLFSLVRGDLGRSFVTGEPVTSTMATRAPVTLSLIVATLVLTLVFSVILGVLAARRGGFFDRGVQVMSVVLGAVPSYLLGLMLVITFAINLRVFPATGFVPITQSFTGWLATMALPSISIAAGAIFGLAVWIRSSIVDVQRREFVRTLRSRGLSSTAITYRHVLRNAAAPTVQMLGLMIISLVGGTIIIERVFALNGVGSMALNAGELGDIPQVLGAVTFMVLVIVITNLAVDLLNGFLNPKVRTA